MKRLLAPVFSLALIFSLSPIHTLVQAEENPKEGNATTLEQPVKTPETKPAPDTKEEVPAGDEKQKPAEEKEKETTQPSNETQQPPTNNNNNGSTENTTPVTETKMEIHRQVSETAVAYTIQAKLKDVKAAEGTWTFYVDGKKTNTKKNKKTNVAFNLNLESDFEEAGELRGHDIKIVFEGKVDGKDSKVEGTQSIPDINFEYAQVGNNDKFTGTLNPATKAVGYWSITIGKEENDDIIDMKEVENFNGTSFSHTFTGIGKGKYIVLLAFDGKVDGEETLIVKYSTLEVTGEGNNGGEIKPPPTDYKPTKPVDKNTVEQVIKNTKKGGKMPKTATSNPTGMFAGIALLALGGAVLGYRRLVK
ncbi:LPXTG cell wall anchor domain-containing protein [Shimazuella kribbensis]|uniref:LPXTG cell wall anchor domain-containing protein n=1 Tax=Shimazuella kribbensis TaxID=139808 RepID=UPI00041B5234|nr:LPXTG cell wall anchor domain-containing protein [Shimazuella kribbensis]